MTAELPLINGGVLSLDSLPVLSYDTFAAAVVQAVSEEKCTVIAYFANESQEKASELEVVAVLGRPAARSCAYPGVRDTSSIHSVAPALSLLRGHLPRTFPSLTPDCPQLHLFEREIAEQFGVTPTGHPWLKPVRFHQVWRGNQDAWGRDPRQHPVVGDMTFFQVEGDEIHEVGVGPVHAGIIEPGHFRFQCFGERVLHLEISLGYQHRGIERLLTGIKDGAGGVRPHLRTAAMIETMAGDTTTGHTVAYSQVLEALAGITVPVRARAWRGLALELERLANHVGDFGALAGDVGFLPTASYCGRLRGDYLNMTAQLCGSRFGRGLVRPGGVLFDGDRNLREKLRRHLLDTSEHTDGAVELFFETNSVVSRLEGVGKVAEADAAALGLVGVAGRACNLDCDVRRLYPTLFENDREHPLLLGENGGDVYDRAHVRRQEIWTATEWILRELQNLPAGKIHTAMKPLTQRSLSVSLVEGWRGRIAHIGMTDASGRLCRYKVVDPSFFNWSGLAMALRDEQISDFPLCNKSFNLSYCGFDL